MSENVSVFAKAGSSIKAKFISFGNGIVTFFKTPSSYVKLGSVLAIIGLAIVLFFVGKEHQFLLDNNTIEINGKSYSSLNLVSAKIDNSDFIEIPRRTRMNNFQTGQSHKITLNYIENGQEKELVTKFKVPASEKNTLISLPALIAGADQSEWMSEFLSVQAPVPDEPAVEDDMAMDMDGMDMAF